MDKLFQKRLKQYAAKIDILVVDDDYSFRLQMISKIFEPLGFKSISSEGDGRSGLIAFQKIQPQLIVTDFDMPFMTGTDMIARVFASKNDHRLQVIMMTEYVSLRSVQHSLRENSGKIQVFDKSILREALDDLDKDNQTFWDNLARAMLWSQT